MHLSLVASPEEKAKAAAAVLANKETLASKQDLQKEIAELKVEIATEFKALYRYLWLVGAGIVAMVAALNAMLIALNKLFS